MSIGIVGDAMIDVYDKKYLPGGAALCASLCNGNLYSFITRDFKKKFPKIKTANCLFVSQMTTKVYDAGMKLDFDVIKDYPYLFKPTEDIILYCDYAKGCLNNVVLPKNKITIVDPKTFPLERWIGCTIFKLNKKEAIDLTGEEDMKLAVQKLKKLLKCEIVIVTLGEEGIIGQWKKPFRHRLAAVEIKNSVGAGDSFVSALALNYREDLEELAILAMHEATKYCQEER